MKQTKYALLVFSVALCFSSCNKDYTCRCTGGIAKSGHDVYFQNISYSKAKNDCKNYSDPFKGPDAVSCELLTDK